MVCKFGADASAVGGAGGGAPGGMMQGGMQQYNGQQMVCSPPREHARALRARSHSSPLLRCQIGLGQTGRFA